jgi:hypothetical protein
LFGNQAVVGAALYNMPLLDYQNLIGLANGAEAVRNDKGRAVFH